MKSLSKIIQRKKLRKARLEQSLSKIITQLKSKGALKIILFGSLAEGKIAPDSDLDLLVVMPKTKTGRQWLREIYQEIERGVACDFLVYNLREFEEMREKKAILREALKKGKVVYTKRRDSVIKRDAGEEAKRWFIQAKDEFQDAEELRKRERFYLALFHFQQATGKALKAYLYRKVASEEVFFTHSILELLQTAKDLDKDFTACKQASKLDQYYIPTRYPNGLPGGVPSQFYKDPEQAKEAMQLAKKVIDMVEEKAK